MSQYDDEAPARSVYDSSILVMIGRWLEQANKLNTDEDLDLGISRALRHCAGELDRLLRVAQEQS